MIALEIGLEAGERLMAPKPIAFAEAIPIAALGLMVNLASAWLLSRGGHHHHHHHGHAHAHEESQTLRLGDEVWRLSIYEDGVPPRFRLEGPLKGRTAAAETRRPGGARQRFSFVDRGGFLESVEEIPEPHAFEAVVEVGGRRAHAKFEEHDHAHLDRDHNMRAAIVHVLADAAVSVLVIVGLSLGWLFGWTFMDPLAALVGAFVIASWAYQLARDTGAVLLDMNPDAGIGDRLRAAVEGQGDALADLHLWRLGPGHLGAIVSIESARGLDRHHYKSLVEGVARFSHLTIEVVENRAAPPRRDVA
jgi:cation diffusion facilitator family transporter